MSGKIFDLTGSYHAAFMNGIAWNLLNLTISGWLFWRIRSKQGNQFIAAIFGDQEPRIGRICLDFLPQTVDMGFQRMGRHASIIAPNLVQQHIAGDHAGLRAVEVFQDVGFLFRQTDFLFLGIQQQLLGGLERIGPHLENRVFGLFVLANGNVGGQQIGVLIL